MVLTPRDVKRRDSRAAAVAKRRRSEGPPPNAASLRAVALAFIPARYRTIPYPGSGLHRATRPYNNSTNFNITHFFLNIMNAFLYDLLYKLVCFVSFIQAV